MQKRAIPTFYYALKPRGYLMLGPSESLGSFEELFTLIDKKHKIYQKKRSTARVATHFIGPEYAVPRLEPAHSPIARDRELTWIGKWNAFWRTALFPGALS